MTADLDPRVVAAAHLDTARAFLARAAACFHLAAKALTDGGYPAEEILVGADLELLEEHLPGSLSGMATTLVSVADADPTPAT